MNKTITIIIAPDGKTIIETDGYSGSSCREASRFLEEALGTGTIEHLKPECFFDENINHQQKEQCQC